VATSFASHSFNTWTFLHISTRKCPGSPCSQNGCTANSQYVRFHEAVIAYWLLKNPDLNQLTMRSGAFCKSECTIARFVTSAIRKNNWFMNGAGLISVSLTEQSTSGDSVCVAVSARKMDTLNIRLKHCHVVRLRTSCYWVVVQSYICVILFTVWFTTNAKTNFPETLHHCLQYIWVCVDKIIFDLLNFTARH